MAAFGLAQSAELVSALSRGLRSFVAGHRNLPDRLGHAKTPGDCSHTGLSCPRFAFIAVPGLATLQYRLD